MSKDVAMMLVAVSSGMVLSVIFGAAGLFSCILIAAWLKVWFGQE